MDKNKNKNWLVEKIIKDLSHALFRPGLTEFDIVPVESNQNKSPVLCIETSVGLESWCVKSVYMYCYTELMDDYFTHPKRRHCRPSNLNNQRLTTLLNATLLINPDVTSLWNKRREMVDKHLLEWVSEMQFSRLVISRKPKCNDAFAYRRWILGNVLKEELVHPHQFIDAVIVEELSVIKMAVNKCPNNYHCWDYRRWFMNILWNIRFDFQSTLYVFHEYRSVHRWTSNNVSDYSGFHYLQFVIKKLYYIEEDWEMFENMLRDNLLKNFQKIIDTYIPNDPTVKPNKTFKKTIEGDDLIGLVLGHCPGNCKCNAPYFSTLVKFKILFYELVVNSELLKYYKYHETLWYHRRFLVHEILAAMYDHLEIERKNGKLQRKVIPDSDQRKHKCQNCLNEEIKEHKGKIEKFGTQWIFHSPLFKVLINCELDFIQDRQKDSDIYADRHEHYLKYVEGLNGFI